MGELLPSASPSDANQETSSVPPLPPSEDTDQTLRSAGRNHQQARRAILVMHGIGSQQRFEALDSFANGLRSVSPPMTVTHCRVWEKQHLYHFVRLEGDQCVDIHELYWAPLAVGKGSFLAVVHWLVSTGFTPLRRLAFNLPLLIQRARNKAKMPSWSSSSGYTLQWDKFFGLVLAYVCLELLRGAAVLLTALLLAGFAAALVSSASTLLKDLTTVIRALTFTHLWRDTLTAFVFLGLLAATLALLWSLHKQVRDLIRAWNIRPREALQVFLLELVWEIVVQVLRLVFAAVEIVLLTIVNAVLDLLRIQTSLTPEWAAVRHRVYLWGTEVSGRLLCVGFSAIAIPVLVWLIMMLSQPELPGFVSWLLTPLVHHLYTQLGNAGLFNLLRIGGLLVLGAFLKRVFVDYMADVALYTTRDEHSSFAQTRRDILDEATRRVRWLLRRYDSVALAGHSLGSVISYDVISRLCDETQVGDAMTAQRHTHRQDIEKVLHTLPSQVAERIEGVLDALEQQLDRTSQEGVTPICTEELKRLTTLITFGSPLNKVLYFFRVHIDTHQTIRAYILNKLQTFRRPQELLTSDHDIRAGVVIEANYRACDTRQEDLLQGLFWLNVYSPLDPVSAKLVFYDRVYEYRRWYWTPGYCHMSYWYDRHFYEEVVAALDHHPRRAILSQSFF